MRRCALRLPVLPLVVAVAVTVVAATGPVAPGDDGVLAASATSGAAAPDGDPPVAPETLFPAGGPSATTAWDVSARHWGAVPCGGKVEVAWTRLDPGTNATASWYNPTDAWDNAGENFDCRIDFNAAMAFDWEKFCTVFAHETGHLLGRRHADGDLLMDPAYSSPLPACEQTAEPAAPAPATASGPAVEPATTAAASVSHGPAARFARTHKAGGKTGGSGAVTPGCRVKRRHAGRLKTRRLRCVRAADPGRARVVRGWSARQPAS